ncbi:MAG: hypothetical protein MUE31_11280, partial [Candidatus Nanopelagicales bacterium]|nr:hypothetical protein [Candidatus Nanopelagicales bacterium]
PPGLPRHIEEPHPIHPLSSPARIVAAGYDKTEPAQNPAVEDCAPGPGVGQTPATRQPVVGSRA